MQNVKERQKEFIENAKRIHDNKYDYSKVDYINNTTKVCIICPIHGEFWQTPNNHLQGKGCKKCSQEKKSLRQRLSKDEFIKKAQVVHGDKYDYSKVNYINAHTKVCIICPEHGEFWQRPNAHLKGLGCDKCGKTYSYTTEEWINEAKKVHGDKYDYSKVDYKTSHVKVCIICPIHGEFWQDPNSHLQGHGCKKCVYEEKSIKQRKTKEEWINEVKKVHGNKYDYSKVDYINDNTKVCIICPIHGEFWQTPRHHIEGAQCPKCSNKHKYTVEEFIEMAKQVHGNKYDYSKVEYINSHTKVCIICPKHGEFWVTPYHHIRGRYGCPICKESHLENEIRLFLQQKEIVFETQKKFDWLSQQRLDFYLPQYNCGIECQGKQHFESVEHFGGEESLKNAQKCDNKKKQLCKEHGLRLLYYSNLGIDYPYEVFEDKEKLLEEVKKIKK